MFDQPKAELYEASPYFSDGSSARPLVEGTVSRQRGSIDATYVSGQDENGLLSELPIPVSLGLLQRGQERYNIYCSPCHNYSGDGQGMIVQRGFPSPTSFHDQRLRDATVGYFYNAMTNGFGRMLSYASRIPPEDRWAIAAYIRALQLSQYATLEDVPEDIRLELLQSQGAIR
ncbi:MAG: cytochrome c [Trueperaceae bacterium]|nr:MAG: cytochrome c [Trueperaceae bacterium]